MESLSSNIVGFLRLAAVLVAAIAMGNWYMAENRKNKLKNGPWYGAYISVPGLMIIASILILPIVWVLFNR